MTTKTITISMDEQYLESARAAANAAGQTFSAYVTEAVRSRWLREQGRRYRAMVRDRSPEDQQAVDALAQAAAAALFGSTA